MSLQLNKVTLAGYLGKDVELKFTTSGKAIASASLGISSSFGKGDERKTNTTWVNLIAWEGKATFLSENFKKGSPIYVEGSLNSRSYDNKEGVKVYVTEVNVQEIKFVESRAAGETSEAVLSQAQPAAATSATSAASRQTAPAAKAPAPKAAAPRQYNEFDEVPF